MSSPADLTLASEETNASTSGNKVAVITGGTSGIAYGIAEELIKEHGSMDLVLCYLRDVEGAKSAATKLEQATSSTRVSLVQGNIAEESTVQSIFQAVDAFGRIDIVVHSAGTGSPGKGQKLGDGSLIDEDGSIDFEDFDYYQSVYPKAFMRLIEGALKRIPESQKSASFVAISSPGCNNTQAVVNVAAYDLRGPAKGTLETLVRYYGKRLAPRGITVNAVIPGTVFTKAWNAVAPPGMSSADIFDKVTESIPMKRGATAQEIGGVVAFLCSEKARYITGVALPVDGGFHLGAV